MDSSILVGALRGEPDVVALLPHLATAAFAIAAPAVVEVEAWCARNLVGGRSDWLSAVLASSTVTVQPFTAAMADASAEAFRRMGRGSGHPAALNFGDALVYGHAVTLGLPLLFKGADFVHKPLAIDPRSIVLD